MYEFHIGDHKYNNIHFIGIGGISMSGLAEILIKENYNVSGSDSKDSLAVERLRKLGAKIYIGHNEKNIGQANLVIYTDAISKDNVELMAAYEAGIQVIDRATFLGALMKNYSNSIAVSGTHGKTTTTSMIATIISKTNLNPTILLGGELDSIGGNVKIGKKDFILTEACEYKGNILKYFPTMAIVLNIDEDHLDYFKSINHIIDTFVGYGKNLEESSHLVINTDDIYAKNVIENTKASVITFGINTKADYRAENITFSEEGFPSFILNIKGKKVCQIFLNVMGIHNIYNALASIAATHTYGISLDIISENIKSYRGVHRRLELKGYFNDIKIMDDYAHHPTEIKATLNALKKSTKGNIYCIFQPHTFTRTKILLNSFAEAFADADKIIIADIYAAREKDNGEIHSKNLADAIRNKGFDAIYLSTFEEIESYLLDNVKDEDTILTMGAGNIYLVGESILKHNNEKAAV